MDLKQFQTMDSMILLSIINMKLRDEFSSLDDLVRYYEIDKDALIAKLADAGFDYQPQQNQFR